MKIIIRLLDSFPQQLSRLMPSGIVPPLTICNFHLKLYFKGTSYLEFLLTMFVPSVYTNPDCAPNHECGVSDGQPPS
jgi:hypothetical protein